MDYETNPQQKKNKSELFTKQYLDITEKNLFFHKILYTIFYRFPMIVMIYIILFIEEKIMKK